MVDPTAVYTYVLGEASLLVGESVFTNRSNTIVLALRRLPVISTEQHGVPTREIRFTEPRTSWRIYPLVDTMGVSGRLNASEFGENRNSWRIFGSRQNCVQNSAGGYNYTMNVLHIAFCVSHACSRPADIRGRTLSVPVCHLLRVLRNPFVRTPEAPSAHSGEKDIDSRSRPSERVYVVRSAP
jgi:hypothetical protein